jgi:hypothetical protein
MRLFVLFLLLGLCAMAPLTAQRYLLVETANRAQTLKIQEGSTLTYRMQGESDWLTGKIVELRADQQLVAIDNYYLDIRKVDALRQTRPWALPTGVMLTTFGAAWSGFALIGKATDGNPDTRYEARDAVISGVSLGVGLAIGRLLRHKVLKLGDRRRLRIVDVSFR